MINSETHQMKDNQFPFGLLNDKIGLDRKILIKKTYKYKSQAEHFKLKQKIDKLKTISNKNTINLRYIEDSQTGYINLFYPYVDLPLEEVFTQEPEISVKDLHKQFISLAIFLAKNYILTSFNPNRCGVVLNDGQFLIKYYLPLNEIIITPKLNLLQRSVQLFNLQSMHYLDILCQSVNNTSMDNTSQCSFRYGKVSPSSKLRKESQPVGTVRVPRKFSTNPNIQQIRKLSNLSKELSQFSQMRNRRKTKESTRVSGGSFFTMNNLASQKSERTLIQSIDLTQAKNYQVKVLKIKERSIIALNEFKSLKGLIEQHRSLSQLIIRIKY